MTTDADPTAPGGAPPKAAVFISYSRKDVAFVDKLDAALTARGFEPLIDREEIYAFEDWWKRIEALIVKADTIVFVLSPDAIASDICGKEVEFAQSLNKRFAPIVCRRVADNLVPPGLRRLNFIFCDDEARFDNSIAQLAEALDTDIEWVRKHTEFGEVAQRWAAAGRPGPRGLLLRSPVLEEAEHWIASRPGSAPTPTDTTREFIFESRRAINQVLAYNNARASALESYVRPLLQTRIKELENQSAEARSGQEAGRSMLTVGFSGKVRMNESEIDAIRNFMRPNGNWHPEKAVHEDSLNDPRADYLERYRFPCCNTWVLTEDREPEQFRADGCQGSPEDDKR